MRLKLHAVICALVVAGCHAPQLQQQAAEQDNRVASEIVTELNKQIEQFNAGRQPDMGITPIAQRVSCVNYAGNRNAMNSYDENGSLFVVLERQPDGSFRGIRKVKFHELPKPEGHRWGDVVVKFVLPREIFQKNAPPK